MILITGATGPLGKAVVNALLKKTSPTNIAVLARDTAKAQELKDKGVAIRQGDYNDYDSLVKAFTGVDKLYFVSGNDVVNRTQQHENVVKAARAAGVKHVVYTSFQRKNETGTSPIAFVAQSHLATEQVLKASGLRYTILKHTIYLDMLPMFFGEKVLETGVIFQPSGNGKSGYVSRNDMAEAAANILTSEGHENKTYEISSPATYSYADLAAILSEISGKPVNHVSPEPEVFIQELTKAGVPADYAGMFTGFSLAKKEGEFDLADNTLTTLLGRAPVTPKEFLKAVYGKH